MVASAITADARRTIRGLSARAVFSVIAKAFAIAASHIFSAGTRTVGTGTALIWVNANSIFALVAIQTAAGTFGTFLFSAPLVNVLARVVTH